MKKRVFILFLILFLPFTSAIQYICTEVGQISSNSEEIEEGKIKSIFSTPLGICGTNENVVLGWIESQVFLDSKIVTLKQQMLRLEPNYLQKISVLAIQQ
jgi:hypothetical protein